MNISSLTCIHTAISCVLDSFPTHDQIARVSHTPKIRERKRRLLPTKNSWGKIKKKQQAKLNKSKFCKQIFKN